MEIDYQVSSSLGLYTTFYRALDVRIGKWLSLDPDISSSETPYSSNRNNPIKYTDPDGDCPPGVDCNAEASLSLKVSLGSQGQSSASLSLGLGLTIQSGPFLGGFNISGTITNGGIGTTQSTTGTGDIRGDLSLSPSFTFGKGQYKPLPLNTFNSNTSTNVYNTYKTSGTFATNFVLNSSGQNQKVGAVGFRSGDFGITLYNDVGLLKFKKDQLNITSDGDDRFWTGGGSATIITGNGGNITFGNDVFTGERNPDHNSTAGYYNQDAYNQSLNMGKTYLSLTTFDGNFYQIAHTGSFDMFSQNVIHKYYPGGGRSFFLSSAYNAWNFSIGHELSIDESGF